jgi:6-phosphogluconolactonase (cycloisomerase 2 family)
MKRLFLTALAAALTLAVTAAAATGGSKAPVGAVYTLSNTAANAVLAFDRASDGTLSPAGSYATGGNGTGGPLGSQGSITLTDDGRYLLAVNAGNDTVSTFAVSNDGLSLLNVVASGGSTPVSVDTFKRTAYVVNAGSRTISGFALSADGLAPLAGSTRTLGGVGAAQISFTPSGDHLVVTNKASSTIDTFNVASDGYAGSAHSTPSTGNTPFGFDFDNKGHLLVSDANNGPGNSAATPYDVTDSGVTALSGPVSTFQGAACWLVGTQNGRYAFTANAGGGSISTFAVDPSGTIALDGNTSLGAGSHPLDEAISNNGQFLYVVVDGFHRLGGYRIGSDGSLTPVASAPIPAGAAGLASR